MISPLPKASYSTGNYRENEKYQKDKEYYFCNFNCTGGNSAKSEYCGDYCHNEKN